MQKTKNAKTLGTITHTHTQALYKISVQSRENYNNNIEVSYINKTKPIEI